jgi:hypothetical protein
MTQPTPQPRLPSPSSRDIVIGATVYGVDNARFGQVAGSYRDYLIVERGFFMPIDYYVPMSAIGRVDGELVVLSVSRDAALAQGWERPPFTSETGQRGLHRSAVGRQGTVTPAGNQSAAPGSRRATRPGAAGETPSAWPPAPVAAPDSPNVPLVTDAPASQTASTPGSSGPGAAAGPEREPVPAAAAAPANAPAAIPATGAFADTYPVGTNTESYHAMTDFLPMDTTGPADGPTAPQQPASGASGSSVTDSDREDPTPPSSGSTTS